MTLDEIVNEIHACLVPIRAQCDRFCSKVEEYAAMLEEYTGKAIKRHEAERERRRKERERQGVELLPGEFFVSASDGARFIRPSPQDEELENGPPEDGWVWTQFCDYKYTGLREMDVFWRPAEPQDPTEWLHLPRFWTTPTLTRKRREWSVDDRLMCECFRLAAIHDHRLIATGSPHERAMLHMPYSGRFARDDASRALLSEIQKSPRGLEDVQISWDWARPRLDEPGKRQAAEEASTVSKRMRYEISSMRSD